MDGSYKGRGCWYCASRRVGLLQKGGNRQSGRKKEGKGSNKKKKVQVGGEVRSQSKN